MRIIISTSNKHKEMELSRYFKDIGLKTEHIYTRSDLIEKENEDFICVREQTQLLNKKTLNPSTHSHFEEVTHISTVTLELKKSGVYSKEDYTAQVDGFIFANKKTARDDVYNWDDIFVSSSTMKTYQDMKDRGVKNSARDMAFSKAIERIKDIFHFENKVNLNFNPSNVDDVISFEPFIKNLFENNLIYKEVYKNKLFHNLINNILNSGIFIRRASDRKEKNYWLPGLNAGIPLTPKKDELHELTFMFHDIMHFIYPDVMIVDESEKSKNKYIISRMMSEAFTLVLADMLFVDVLKSSGVSYDYSKRKIYPVFEKCKFDITPENIDKLEQLLWANTCFALLGSEKELMELVKDKETFDAYKDKYQRFFQEDYRWTHENYKNIVKKNKSNKEMCNAINSVCGKIIPTTDNFAKSFDHTIEYKEQVKHIFNLMFKRLSSFILNEAKYDAETAFTHAVKRYYAGQISLFFKFETLYNDLFMEQILVYMKKNKLSKDDLSDLNELYSVYVDKLKDDNFISEYLAKKYKNICPIFEPFYVFYEAKEHETFENTLNSIFSKE